MRWFKRAQDAALSQVEEMEMMLDILGNRSEYAVSAVRSALYGLEDVNAQIDQTIMEIDDIQNRAAVVKSGLEARKEKNSRIRQNFRSLLCEGEE